MSAQVKLKDLKAGEEAVDRNGVTWRHVADHGFHFVRRSDGKEVSWRHPDLAEQLYGPFARRGPGQMGLGL